MDEDKDDTDETKPVIVRNCTDLQRLKLEKLMKNPEKPIIIPEKPKERGVPNVPDFVRNVMGSSAGAGSGEFHVYRHLRRKEYARQKYMQEKAKVEQLDDDYHNKIEKNKKLAEQRTEKKRLKRLKKKQNKKLKQVKVQKKESSASEKSEDNSDNEDTPSEPMETSEIVEHENVQNKSIEN